MTKDKRSSLTYVEACTIACSTEEVALDEVLGQKTTGGRTERLKHKEN